MTRGWAKKIHTKSIVLKLLNMNEKKNKIGADGGEKNEKTTYVTLKGLEKATRDVEVISQEALELLSGLDRENTYLTQLIQELIHRKK